MKWSQRGSLPQRRKANRVMAVSVRTTRARPASGASRTMGAAPARKAQRHSPAPAFNAAALRRGMSLLLPFVIFLSLGLLLIWERVTVNELAAEIATMETQRNRLIEQNGKLRIEVEHLSGYARISRVAAQLGMVTVPQQMIVVEEE